MATLALPLAFSAGAGTAFGFGLAIVGSIIDSHLISALQGTPDVAEAEKLDFISFPRGKEGESIIELYGEFKVGGQLIWKRKGFNAIKRTTPSQRAGKGRQIPGRPYWQYRSSFATAFCLGNERTRIKQLLLDGCPVNPETLDHQGYEFYAGTDEQRPDPTIIKFETKEAEMEGRDYLGIPAYKGICYVVFDDLLLDRSNHAIPRLQAVIEKPLDGFNDARGSFVRRRTNYVPAQGSEVSMFLREDIINNGVVPVSTGTNNMPVMADSDQFIEPNITETEVRAYMYARIDVPVNINASNLYLVEYEEDVVGTDDMDTPDTSDDVEVMRDVARRAYRFTDNFRLIHSAGGARYYIFSQDYDITDRIASGQMGTGTLFDFRPNHKYRWEYVNTVKVNEVDYQEETVSRTTPFQQRVRHVSLLPGTGSASYDPRPLISDDTYGNSQSPNIHLRSDRADALISMDNLIQNFPNTETLNIPITWFVRNGVLAPGVETSDFFYTSDPWVVSGHDRQSESIHVVEGIGGTPSDSSVFWLMYNVMSNLRRPSLQLQIHNLDSGQTHSDLQFTPELFGGDTARDFSFNDRGEVEYNGNDDDFTIRRMALHYAFLARAAMDATGNDTPDVSDIFIGDGLKGITHFRNPLPAPELIPDVTIPAPPDPAYQGSLTTQQTSQPLHFHCRVRLPVWPVTRSRDSGILFESGGQSGHPGALWLGIHNRSGVAILGFSVRKGWQPQFGITDPAALQRICDGELHDIEWWFEQVSDTNFNLNYKMWVDGEMLSEGTTGSTNAVQSATEKVLAGTYGYLQESSPDGSSVGSSMGPRSRSWRYPADASSLEIYVGRTEGSVVGATSEDPDAVMPPSAADRTIPVPPDAAYQGTFTSNQVADSAHFRARVRLPTDSASVNDGLLFEYKNNNSTGEGLYVGLSSRYGLRFIFWVDTPEAHNADLIFGGRPDISSYSLRPYLDGELHDIEWQIDVGDQSTGRRSMLRAWIDGNHLLTRTGRPLRQGEVWGPPAQSQRRGPGTFGYLRKSTDQVQGNIGHQSSADWWNMSDAEPLEVYFGYTGDSLQPPPDRGYVSLGNPLEFSYRWTDENNNDRRFWIHRYLSFRDNIVPNDETRSLRRIHNIFATGENAIPQERGSFYDPPVTGDKYLHCRVFRTFDLGHGSNPAGVDEVDLDELYLVRYDWGIITNFWQYSTNFRKVNTNSNSVDFAVLDEDYDRDATVSEGATGTGTQINIGLGTSFRWEIGAPIIPGEYPGADEMASLVSDVKALFRNDTTKISYIADHDEYHSDMEMDSLNMDKIWDACDVISIRSGFPISDWRDEAGHLDSSLAPDIYDLDYLRSQIEGGEGYDYEYASQADRDSQTRTPIANPTWRSRIKDVRGWKAATGGDRLVDLTQKPLYFFLKARSIDKATNAPASDSPHYSDGLSDKLIQRRYFQALGEYWRNPENTAANDQRAELNPAKIFYEFWDIRPYPLYPQRTDLFSDSRDWETGFTISGKVKSNALAEVVESILRDSGGLSESEYNIRLTDEYIPFTGYATKSISSAADKLSDLAAAFQFNIYDANSVTNVEYNKDTPVIDIDPDDFILTPQFPDGYEIDRKPESEIAEQITLGYQQNEEKDYEPGKTNSRSNVIENGNEPKINLPVVLSDEDATKICDIAIQEGILSRNMLQCNIPLSYSRLSPGDYIRIKDRGTFRIKTMREGTYFQVVAEGADPSIYEETTLISGLGFPVVGGAAGFVPIYGNPIGFILDIPHFEADSDGRVQYYFAAGQNPMPPAIILYAPIIDEEGNIVEYEDVASVTSPSVMGRTVGMVPRPSSDGSVINRETTIRVALFDKSASLSSVSVERMLNDPNRQTLAIRDRNRMQTHNEGWELKRWANAEFAGRLPTGHRMYDITMLVDGAFGTENLIREYPDGSDVVFLDTDNLAKFSVQNDILAIDEYWKMAPSTELPNGRFSRDIARPALVDSLRYPSPINLRKSINEDGNLVFEWDKREFEGFGAEALDADESDGRGTSSLQFWIRIISEALVERGIFPGNAPSDGHLTTRIIIGENYTTTQSELEFRAQQFGVTVDFLRNSTYTLEVRQIYRNSFGHLATARGL